MPAGRVARSASDDAAAASGSAALDALLLEHLAAHEATCPRCGHLVHRIPTPTCPECGDRLRLELDGAEVGDLAWAWAMSGFLAAGGFFVIASIGMVTTRLLGGGGRGPDVRELVVPLLACAGGAGVVASLRRRFRRWRHRGPIGGIVFVFGLGFGLVLLYRVG